MKNIITDESIIFINKTQERFRKILDKALVIFNYSIRIGKRSSFLIKDFNNNININNIFNNNNIKKNENYKYNNDSENEININYRRSLFKDEENKDEEILQQKPRYGLDNEYYRD